MGFRTVPPDATAALPIETGTRSGTTDPAGNINITHGLGDTPTGVWLQTADSTRATLNGSPTSTTIAVRVLNSAGTPVAGTPVTIYWMAVTS